MLMYVKRAMNSQYLNGSMDCTDHWASVHTPFGERGLVRSSFAFSEVGWECQCECMERWVTSGMFCESNPLL